MGGEVEYAQVIVELAPAHLDRPFDYAVPADMDPAVQVGSRVEVVFAGRRRLGVVAGLSASSEVAPDRVRPIRRVLGPHVWVRPDELELARWAGERFAAPVADVLRHGLPARTVDVERRAAAAGWFPPGATDRPACATGPAVDGDGDGWEAYGRGGTALSEAAGEGRGAWYWRPLPGERVGTRLTELIRRTLAGGRDALVVVPDPASAAADAVVAAFGDLVVDARGGPSARRTYGLWLRARCGQARVVVGERGACLWPLERLGLGVVVDEANPALKERRSPRHHAREVVLERARRAGAVGLLVGTVPSAVGWRLLRERRLRTVTPARAVERSAAPLVEVATGEAARTRISGAGLRALRAAVREGGFGVVLAARRGEGRALVCSGCGRRLACPECDASLAPVPASRPGGRTDRGTDARDGTAATRPEGLQCLACGWTSRRAVSCRGCGVREFVPLAAGAQRLGAELDRALDVPVAVLEGYGQPAPDPPAVLVMTRGSVLDAPPGPVGAVVLPDLDGQLRRPQLDATEDTLRLAMQLAAWTVHGVPVEAGGSRSFRQAHARVVVQTADPDHPVVQALARWDPGGFWRTEAAARSALRFPPAAHAIRLTAAGDGLAVTSAVRDALGSDDEVLGPLPDGDQAVLLVKTDAPREARAALTPLRHQWSKDGLDVRVDVDP